MTEHDRRQEFAARANGLRYETREVEAAYDTASKLYAAKLAALSERQRKITDRWRRLAEEIAAAGGVEFDMDAAIPPSEGQNTL